MDCPACLRFRVWRDQRLAKSDCAQDAQRVVLRYALLGAYVAKHIQLLTSFPRMSSSYQLELWMQESLSVPARFFLRGCCLASLQVIDGNSF